MESRSFEGFMDFLHTTFGERCFVHKVGHWRQRPSLHCQSTACVALSPSCSGFSWRSVNHLFSQFILSGAAVFLPPPVGLSCGWSSGDQGISIGERPSRVCREGEGRVRTNVFCPRHGHRRVQLSGHSKTGGRGYWFCPLQGRVYRRGHHAGLALHARQEKSQTSVCQRQWHNNHCCTELEGEGVPRTNSLVSTLGPVSSSGQQKSVGGSPKKLLNY